MKRTMIFLMLLFCSVFLYAQDNILANQNSSSTNNMVWVVFVGLVSFVAMAVIKVKTQKRIYRARLKTNILIVFAMAIIGLLWLLMPQFMWFFISSLVGMSLGLLSIPIWEHRKYLRRKRRYHRSSIH